MFELVGSTPCETFYKDEVSGERIRLWAIHGGVLAVAFESLEFTQRLNHCDAFDSKKDPNWPQWNGPRLCDVAGGAKRIREWFDKSIVLRAMRRERFARIMEITQHGLLIKSRRFHDLGNRVYMWCELHLHPWHASPVTCKSSVYWGRCEDSITNWADENWKALAGFLNPIFDATGYLVTWEGLDGEVFEELLEKLRKVV